MGNLLGAFKAPTPDEVDEHHAGIRGLGEEKLVWRQPFLKIGGDGKNLPEVPGEDNVHIAKAVDTLGRYSDPGDHPRWTARDIGAEGPVAVARTRDMLRQLQEKAPDLVDAYLRKLFALPLPEGTREALTGEPEPERIPVGVFKEEWEKRRRPFDTMECTPEKCGNDARPLGLAKPDDPSALPQNMLYRMDDPEEEDRRRRLANIERRRAERASTRNLSLDGSDIGGGAGNDTLAVGAGNDRPSDGGALDMGALDREFRAYKEAIEAGEKPDINDYPQLGKLSAMAREAGSTRSRDTERDTATLDLPPPADPGDREPEKDKGTQVAALPLLAAPLVPPALEALAGLGLGIAGGIGAKTTYDYLRGQGVLGRTEQVDPPTPTPGYPADPPAGIDARPQGRPATPVEAPKPLENIPPRVDPKDHVEVYPDGREEANQPLILETRRRPESSWVDLGAGEKLPQQTEDMLGKLNPSTVEGIKKHAILDGHLVGYDRDKAEIKTDATEADLTRRFDAWRKEAGLKPENVESFEIRNRKTGDLIGQGRRFDLEDGTRIIQRSYSKEGNPTLEIWNESKGITLEKRFIPGWRRP